MYSLVGRIRMISTGSGLSNNREGFRRYRRVLQPADDLAKFQQQWEPLIRGMNLPMHVSRTEVC
jgi:hypothetical protein